MREAEMQQLLDELQEVSTKRTDLLIKLMELQPSKDHTDYLNAKFEGFVDAMSLVAMVIKSHKEGA